MHADFSPAVTSGQVFRRTISTSMGLSQGTIALTTDHECRPTRIKCLPTSGQPASRRATRLSSRFAYHFLEAAAVRLMPALLKAEMSFRGVGLAFPPGRITAAARYYFTMSEVSAHRRDIN